MSAIGFTQTQTTVSLTQPETPIEERPPTSQTTTAAKTTINTVHLPTTIPTISTDLPSPLTDKIKRFAASITKITEKKFMEEVTNTTKWSCGPREEIINENKKNSEVNKKNSLILSANASNLYWQHEELPLGDPSNRSSRAWISTRVTKTASTEETATHTLADVTRALSPATQLPLSSDRIVDVFFKMIKILINFLLFRPFL
jgi:hypothetical protein